jgi:hypothetical protein
MGKLVLAGAIEGLGAGLGKAAEQRGRMAQEAERTSRDIALQRMRDKSAMERRGEQEVGLNERLEARYGPGGFEETLSAVKHKETMLEIKERGEYAVKAAGTSRDPNKVQTVKYQTFDEQGFPLGEDMAVVRNDAETGMALAQITKAGVTLDVPVSMLKAGAQGPPESKEGKLWARPDSWEFYERQYGELPAWFNTYFYAFKEGRKRKKETPTPRLGGDTQPVVAARGQVQREGAGGGPGGTAPAPDLKERLLTRASEMQ